MTKTLTTTKTTKKALKDPPTTVSVSNNNNNNNIVLEHDSPDGSDGGKSKKGIRKSYSRDDINKEFEDIIASFETLIENIRTDNNKKKNTLGVAPIRSLKSKVLSLKKKAMKLIKPKKNESSGAKKNTNVNSGFLKPVSISPEMAKFTGFDANVKYSRVDVTKFLCDYIKTHGLQNPTDRRQINLDPKLSKLLKYDSTGKVPLTYFQLQSHLKHHFINDGTKKINATV
jgi:chromatin remodeling complex protein RSC6